MLDINEMIEIKWCIQQGIQSTLDFILVFPVYFENDFADLIKLL